MSEIDTDSMENQRQVRGLGGGRTGSHDAAEHVRPAFLMDVF